LLDALCPLVETAFRHGFLLLLIHDFHRAEALGRVQDASHLLRVEVCLADRHVRFVLVEPPALASELVRSWELGRLPATWSSAANRLQSAIPPSVRQTQRQHEHLPDGHGAVAVVAIDALDQSNRSHHWWIGRRLREFDHGHLNVRGPAVLRCYAILRCYAVVRIHSMIPF